MRTTVWIFGVVELRRETKTGKIIKSFGENGIINIKSSSPLPPTIVDDQLIIATFKPSIEAYDVFSGKLYWRYYLREVNKKIFEKKLV